MVMLRQHAHPCISRLNALLEGTRVVVARAAVAGREHDGRNAFVDVEVVEEVRIVVEQSISWVSSEVECAAALG